MKSPVQGPFQAVVHGPARLVSIRIDVDVRNAALIRRKKGWVPQDAAVRDRRIGAGRDLRHRCGRSGHHVHLVGHLELRVRCHGVLHRPFLLFPAHHSRTGASRSAAVVSILVAAPAMGVVLYLAAVPLPPVVGTPDQGRGDDRPARRPPCPGDSLDLRERAPSRRRRGSRPTPTPSTSSWVYRSIRTRSPCTSASC